MHLSEHLDELRRRFMRSLVVFFVGFGLCYWQSEWFLEILRRPLFQVLPPEQQKLYFTSLFENFLTHLKVSGYAALFVMAPYFFYEAWAFVAPGLYARERRWVVPFVAVASLFFVGGAVFAYTVLFPVGFHFFVTYGSPTDVPLLTIDAYYGTALKLMLLFGLAFELPVFICLLGFMGLINSEQLRAQRRTAILGITVLSALFAPPDAVSMLLLGGPLVLMYEASIWVVHVIGKSRKNPRRSPETDITPSPLEGRSRP
jgi:sec-independent protein translocase protein TatC